MAEPWVAVAAGIRRNHKMTALPSDTARYGWIVALGEAKLLDRSGTFTPGQWDEVMGRFARYQADYVSAGLLHVAPATCGEERCGRGRDPRPGTIVVHDWPVHQREHAQRQAGYRRRQRDTQSDASSDAEGDSGSDLDSDAPSRALSLSMSMSPVLDGDSGVGEVGESAIDAYYRLTVRPPGSNVIAWLDRLCSEHPEPRVVGVMAAEWAKEPNPSDFLGRVQTRLAVLAHDEARQAERRQASESRRRQQTAMERRASATPEEVARQDEMWAKLKQGVAGIGKAMP